MSRQQSALSKRTIRRSQLREIVPLADTTIYDMRMNRTIKDATVKRFHYESHDQLRVHLADFMAAYDFARRLKTLGGLTPYEYIAKIWTSEP